MCTDVYYYLCAIKTVSAQLVRQADPRRLFLITRLIHVYSYPKLTETPGTYKK